MPVIAGSVLFVEHYSERMQFRLVVLYLCDAVSNCLPGGYPHPPSFLAKYSDLRSELKVVARHANSPPFVPILHLHASRPKCQYQKVTQS